MPYVISNEDFAELSRDANDIRDFISSIHVLVVIMGFLATLTLVLEVYGWHKRRML